MISTIKNRWFHLLAPFKVNNELAAAILNEIEIAYRESWRHYHTLDHISRMLTTINNVKYLAADPASIYLAAWLHDVVYDPKLADNEEKSAEKAHHFMTTLSLPEEIIDKVLQMIMSTKGHQNPVQNVDINILLDADLAILGSRPLEFRTYCQAIRLEYHWVSDLDFRTGRISILKSFLERPTIFQTKPLRNLLEATARENISNEIIRLSS